MFGTDMTRLLERLIVVEGFPIQNMASALNTGAWVRLTKYRRLVFLLVAAPGTDGGTSGDSVVLTLQQATDTSGTGVKALNFIADGQSYYTKMAATNVEAVGQWTANPVTPVTNVITIAHTLAADDMLLAVEVSADELDVANGFIAVNATVAQLTSTRNGTLLYLMSDARYPAAPDTMLSPLT